MDFCYLLALFCGDGVLVFIGFDGVVGVVGEIPLLVVFCFVVVDGVECYFRRIERALLLSCVWVEVTAVAACADEDGCQCCQ